MSNNAKRAIVSMVGGLGLILLLLGVLAHLYSTSTGVILMISCWVVVGVLARWWGLKKGKDYD